VNPPAAGGRGGPQRIPRPESFRPGPGAPWSHVGPVSVVSTSEVRQAFEGTGPFDDFEDSVVDRRLLGTLPVELRQTEIRPAAVLCAVFEEGGQAEVILTRRSSRLRSHTGEVSFPGGRLEPGETPLEAALREANEEVGLDPASVEIVGRLSPLSTRRNPSAITPFVGILPARPFLRPNHAEVERAFTVPLAELFRPDVYHEELWSGPDGSERSVTFFDVIGDTVWGATGKVLCELLDLIWALRSSAPAEPAGGPVPLKGHDLSALWHPTP
jgi:8-oxo-dGTP pyrophosphatase MutT (NUDIX family)